MCWRRDGEVLGSERGRSEDGIADIVDKGNENRVIVLEKGPGSVFEEPIADPLADESIVVGDANMPSLFISECV